MKKRELKEQEVAEGQGLKLCCEVNPHLECWYCKVIICEDHADQKKIYDSKCYGFLQLFKFEGTHKWDDPM